MVVLLLFFCLQCFFLLLWFRHRRQQGHSQDNIRQFIHSDGHLIV